VRFMVLVKGDERSEAGVLPSERILQEMGRYNEELTNAGMMLGGEGLHPSSRGARIRFSGSEPSVIDGPFGRPSELLAGFWLMQADSRDQVIEWVKRMPNPDNDEYEVEIREVIDMEEFTRDSLPQFGAQEERARDQADAQR
jgi:hypothetical protein